MRLKEDSSSWHSSGIRRRDFRHALDGPEIPKITGKRQKKPRRKIDHKHTWIEKQQPVVERSYRNLVLKYDGIDLWDTFPLRHISYVCTQTGCPARKYKLNPRYGYEYWKYCRRKHC